MEDSRQNFLWEYDWRICWRGWVLSECSYTVIDIPQKCCYFEKMVKLGWYSVLSWKSAIDDASFFWKVRAGVLNLWLIINLWWNFHILVNQLRSLRFSSIHVPAPEQKVHISQWSSPLCTRTYHRFTTVFLISTKGILVLRQWSSGPCLPLWLLCGLIRTSLTCVCWPNESMHKSKLSRFMWVFSINRCSIQFHHPFCSPPRSSPTLNFMIG